MKTNLALSTPPQPVSVANMVVTAVATNGFFSQLDPAATTPTAFAGVNNSCIFTFVGNATKPAVGDLVRIDGNAQTFFDQVQISSATFAVTGAGVISPVVLADSAAITAALAGGARAPLEGCLVQVTNAIVENPTPAPGGGDVGTNEFAIEGGLRVDDGIFLMSPQPDSIGQIYNALRGVLSWRNSLMKLLPRDAADVVEGPVALAAVEGGFARVGTNSTGIGNTVRVRLNRAADADTVMNLTSLDTSIFTVPATVTVPTGAFAADVTVTALQAGQAALSATLGPDTETATVNIIADDAVATVVLATPNTVALRVGQTLSVTLTLDIPAPVAGATIAMTTTNGNVTVPATVSVAGDALSVEVTLTAAGVGESTVTATLGDAVDIDVVVQDVPAEVDVSGFQVVRVSNSATFTLPANTIVPVGGYVVIGRNATQAAFETFWGTTLAANVTYLNAADRLIVINATAGGYTLRRNAATVLDGPTVGITSPSSFQRLQPVAAADQTSSWSTVGADEATPGSGQEVGAPSASGCYISEISDAVGNGAFVNEFIEIHCDGALP